MAGGGTNVRGKLWLFYSVDTCRDMLGRFGPLSKADQRFRGRQNQGTFYQVLKRLHLRLEQVLIELQTR